MKRLSVALILVLFPLGLLAYTSPGKPTGYVNDFAGVLSPATVAQLNSTIDALTKDRGSEISVVTIPTHGTDETIETYATKLFEEWGIGNAEKDDGALLLIAVQDREMRIEVGYGLEHLITDIQSKAIISEILTPAFQTNDFDGGVTRAVGEMIKLATDPGYEGLSVPQAKDSSGFSFSPDLFYFVLFGAAMLLGRSKSWWMGGVVGGLIGVGVGIFAGIVAGIIGVAVLIPIGLAFDYFVSKNHGKGGPGGPFFGGGFGGGGGGFGGFGGGMSGGGGSSGKW